MQQHRLVSFVGRLFVALVLFGTPLTLRADDPRVPAKPIDVVICLDVSNSMDGLIASAKMKLWDIVNDLAKIKPAPDLRVVLYSYGNTGYPAGNGWVRKESDLTRDLDQISKQLFGLTTRGGTEYVGRVCRDALDQQQWSHDKGALRLVFVCGNEPARQDPEVKLEILTEKAKSKDVVINPIFCGQPQAHDARDWKEFAELSGGRFISIDQDRGTVAVATPMDKKLTELSTDLNKTYVTYGGAPAQEKAINQSVQDGNALKLGGAAGASRAASKAGVLYRNSDWDLIDRCKTDPKFDVNKLPVDQLPDNLKKMSAEEREKYIKVMCDKRDAIQKEIVDLSRERAKFLQDEAKKNPSKESKAFDEAIRAAIREQCATKGIKIPD